jgi:F-type H+-transporting ATPase subunit gamma
MSDSEASLRRQISSAGDLQSVVRSMKALAAASVGQYEKSVLALGDYYRTVELGLGACFRADELTGGSAKPKMNVKVKQIGAIVFGSDQGLVGQFNDIVADFAIKTLASLPGEPQVWAVGQRLHSRLIDAGISPEGLFPVPNSVDAIAPLVEQIQIESEAHRTSGDNAQFYLFHNQPKPGSLYEPVCQRLLPLDKKWHDDLAKEMWPTSMLPQVIGEGNLTVRALIREYLFISLFRACSESLASENASRLSAMQRAEKNIADLLVTLKSTYHRLRQETIDEELFDVVAGFEALK